MTPFNESSPLNPTLVQRIKDVTALGGVFLAGGNVNIQSHYHNLPGPIPNTSEALALVPNLRRIHQGILSKATPGTGIWFFKTQGYLLWLDFNGELKILWGIGILCSGKTVMAAIVINELEARAAAADGAICVAYIYFQYSNSTDLTVRAYLEILVKQTVERHADCGLLANQTYARHINERTQPSETELFELLKSFIEAKAETFYILDALDEAPERLQAVLIRKLALLNVRLFITSRPLAVVEARVADAYRFTISATDEDLDLHIARGIADSRGLQALLEDAEPSLGHDIVSAIKRNCGGMFLHASLQLDAIGRCNNAQDVLDTLEEFPSKIEEVYLRTWERVRDQASKSFLLAKAILVWVLNAARSMTIEEVRYAIATSLETHCFEPRRLVPTQTLISLCCGLVAVDEHTKLVRLVHYTAEDTLRQLLRETFPQPHALLASICITHLERCDFMNTSITSEEEFSTARQADPLLAYASDAWVIHCRRSLDILQSRHRIATFVMKCRAFPAFTSPSGLHYFDVLTPLHIIGRYNLPPDLVHRDIMDDPNVLTGIHRVSPLSIASLSGNDALVQNLLDLEEIQVNITDSDGLSPIMYAAVGGHERAIQELLTHPEVDVNAVDNAGVSGLMQAASRGHTEITKLLLADPDIQVNIVDDEGWSALMKASGLGHEGDVQALLTHPKIEVNLVCNKGWSALMAAAYHGHTNIVQRLLVRSDIEVSMVDRKGRSPLAMAKRKGHEEIVKLLSSAQRYK